MNCTSTRHMWLAPFTGEQQLCACGRKGRALSYDNTGQVWRINMDPGETLSVMLASGETIQVVARSHTPAPAPTTDAPRARTARGTRTR